MPRMAVAIVKKHDNFHSNHHDNIGHADNTIHDSKCDKNVSVSLGLLYGPQERLVGSQVLHPRQVRSSNNGRPAPNPKR